MGADIYTYSEAGTEVAYFRDSYNSSSLFGIINETLDYDDTPFELSWWSLITDGEEDNGHVKVSKIQELHDRLEEAMIKLMDKPVWLRGYWEDQELTPLQRDEELARLVELLTQLRLAQKPGHHMMWSV